MAKSQTNIMKKRSKRQSPFNFNFLLRNKDETKSEKTAQFNLFDTNYVSEVVTGTQISLFDNDNLVEIKDTAENPSGTSTIFDLLGSSSDVEEVFNSEDETKFSTLQNYKITDFNIGKGSDREKFNRNIEAIKTLKAIEADGREATPEEQDILAQYVGWGGFSACFAKGSETNTQLQEILSESEYRDAKASMLTAYYTPPVVIEKIYEFLNSCSFTKGNILEPCCGIGNFFGMLPDSMSESRLYGVELDSISAKIAKYLYPQANIINRGFEKTTFRIIILMLLSVMYHLENMA